jgi:hypothetical protein
MTRTLLPAPDDPDPRHAAQAGPVTVYEQALLGFLVGRRPRVADTGPGQVSRSEPAEDAPADRHERLLYLPAITCCYAIVQYDAASARLVRRITGLFGDAECAETYARDGGYHLYDVVPATAVIPTLP